MATGDLIMLTDRADLKKLALLLRNNEEHLARQVAKSEHERASYLKSVNDSHDTAMSLLDDSTAMHELHAAQGGDKASIAADILRYIKVGINMSLQNIRNCALRVDCIKKIRAHYGTVVDELSTVDAGDVPNIRRLAKEAANFKEAMWQYCENNRSATARALSKAFSLVLRQEGITFQDLVARHQTQRGYQGEFEDLQDAQKLQVYNGIIEESGRATVPKLEAGAAALGVSVLLVTAGIMVWDIVTDAHKPEALLRNTMIGVSAGASFAVQLAVETAVTPIVAGLESGLLIVTLAGLATGLIFGFIFTAISGLIMDNIISSGGAKPPPVSGTSFHTATMPDGMAFANEIAHA